MSRLAEGLSRFFGRVEILARGADEDRRAAEMALGRGHVLEARAHARALLARVPRSPLGLALWADAAEACLLDAEVIEALSQLVEQVPWRPEVWLRLGLAAKRIGHARARFSLERAGAADDPSVAREALLALADMDIVAGDIERAERWLDRVPQHPSQVDAGLALRRAECLLARKQAEQARPWVERAAGRGHSEDDVSGRLRLIRARLADLLPAESHGGDAITLALGAFVLDAPGAAELLSQLVADSGDAARIARVREVVSALGIEDTPRWRAAFALAEGRRSDAKQALLEAAEAKDPIAARRLAALAEQWRDLETLEAVALRDREALPAAYLRLLEALAAEREGRFAAALSSFEAAMEGEAAAWARHAHARLIGSWVPKSLEAVSSWDNILRELRRAATQLERLDAIAPIEALAVERERPLYVAVLGEFNAGKSTLLNALLGSDVAPTGIRPTTANLHWVAWAPDPFARVVVVGGSDRVVPHQDLKATLESLHADGQRVDRVFIYAPNERLKRIELLDTPGFNAPDTSHAEEARRGIEEAHVALWLLDATAPLKESERKVIEQVAAAGVPIQVLVNKRDRVEPSELGRVMDYLTKALDQVGIRSLVPPVALSAQRALAGRLGDDEALASSGWEQVEALLSEHIVNRRDALRERALRRKAARVGEQLLGSAGEAASRVEREQEQARATRVGYAGLSARLQRDRQGHAEAIVSELAPALTQLAADARPVAELEPERRADADLRSYMVERTGDRLAPPLVEAIARRWSPAPPPASLAPLLEPTVRATLSGAAAATRATPYLAGEVLMAAVEVALTQAAAALRRASEEAIAVSEVSRIEQRLAALVQALTASPATTAS